MRFYFFKTSLEQRGNEMRNTLRALPNQTFPDGSIVNIALNVRAPKEKGSHSGGARLDYPEGTVFEPGRGKIVREGTQCTVFAVGLLHDSHLEFLRQ